MYESLDQIKSKMPQNVTTNEIVSTDYDRAYYEGYIDTLK